MKGSFGISNKELSSLIFSDRPVGGLTPRERAMDPTRSRREFLGAAPDELDASWDYEITPEAALMLVNRYHPHRERVRMIQRSDEGKVVP